MNLSEKQCEKCKRILPADAHFCPYCMTVLQTEQIVHFETERYIRKPGRLRFFLLTITAVLVVILILVLSVGGVFTAHRNEEQDTELQQAGNIQQNDSTQQNGNMQQEQQNLYTEIAGAGILLNENVSGTVTAYDIMEHMSDVALIDDATIGLTEDGDLYQWGVTDTRGDLNSDDTLFVTELSPVLILENVKSIEGRERALAAITEDGSLYTWGYKSSCLLGNGQYTSARNEYQPEPVRIMDHVVSVSFGQGVGSALTEDGSLYTWGHEYSEEGGNGPGTSMNPWSPNKIMDGVVYHCMGLFCGAAITEDGSLYMWGDNSGDIINPSTEKNEIATPVKVMDHVVSVDIGNAYCGVIKDDGALYMWGSNSHGQLGIGSDESQREPVKVMEHVKIVKLERSMSAAITEDGSLYIWGDNYYDDSGIPSYRSTPLKIMDHVVDVELSSTHCAALTEDGKLYQWGWNDYGQLGTGDTEGIFELPDNRD